MDDGAGTSAMDWQPVGESTEDGNETDDEVVGEVDVYVAKGLADSLYLLQYPLRPSDHQLASGTEKERGITCEFKPKQQKLQIKLPLDATSSSYDKGRGEQIAINCGASSSATKSKVAPFEKMMDYQNLVSSNAGGFHNNCYAVGFVQNGQLHLTPIKNVLQMRPNFSYLDTADVRSKEAVGSSDAAGESSQDESETEAGPSGSGPVQTVRVKFKEESEYLRKKRESSYQYQQKKRDEEPWIPLTYVTSSNESILDERNLLLGSLNWTALDDMQSNNLPNLPHKDLYFDSSASRVLHLLVPKAEEQKISAPKMPSTVISLNQLRELALPDQVRTLMTNVKVLRFSQLLSLLPPKADVETVQKSVQQCAQLVRGCWVVKSDILHPKGSFSPRTGASADLLCRARDYAMYKFTQAMTLTRREIAHAVKIPNEDIDDILTQLARFKVQSGWHFMYPIDTEYLNDHPEIAQQQTAKWEAKFRELSQHLTLGRQRNLSSNIGSPTPVRRRRTDSGRHSLTDNAGEIDTGLLSPPAATATGPRSRSRSGSGQGASNARSKAKTMAPSAQPQVCNGVGRMSDIRTANNNQQWDPTAFLELKNFLYDAFCTKPVLSLAKILLLLQVRLSESPKDHPLHGCVDEQAIQECAVQLGAAKFDKGQGELTERTIFAFAHGSWPEVRSYLIRFLSERSRGKKDKVAFRLNTFKQACANSLSSDYLMPSDEEMKGLLLEYCALKSGLYTLQDT